MKRKGIGIFLIFVMLLSLCLVTALPVAAADTDLYLVGCWTFNGNADDSSGNGNNATLMGNAYVSGGVLNLDGDADYAEVNDSTSLDVTTEITIEAWVQTNVNMDSDPSMQIVDKGEHISSTGYMLMIYKGDLYGRVNKDMGTACVYAYPNDGEMHHVAYTFKSGEQHLYIDEVLVDSATGSTTIVANSYSLLIGTGVERTNPSDPGPYNWTQTIDEVRMWNKALPMNELGGDIPPVPELPTVILFGISIFGIVGYIGFRRFRNNRAQIS